MLLLDEMDKADAAVPNGLLEALGHGCFPVLGGRVVRTRHAWAPLVIITTNEERALPDAFLRRCMVLPLILPPEQKAVEQWLFERGQAHFGEQLAEDLRRRAAELVAQDRAEVQKTGLVPPGQAEYLDLLRAMIRLREEATDPLPVLERVARYALRKHPQEEAEE